MELPRVRLSLPEWCLPPAVTVSIMSSFYIEQAASVLILVLALIVISISGRPTRSASNIPWDIGLMDDSAETGTPAPATKEAVARTSNPPLHKEPRPA